MTDRELLQQALDALKNAETDGNCEYGVTEALRARLAQPEPEPYGYIARRNWKMPVFIEADNVEATGLPYNNADYEPVFKAPPQREPESILNSVHCNCGASWTFKDGALEYKPSKRENNND